jgi:hypothetical protein
VSKQTQVQTTRKPAKRETAPADAPTVNRKIARTWFTPQEENS